MPRHSPYALVRLISFVHLSTFYTLSCPMYLYTVFSKMKRSTQLSYLQ
jgi:hypothetical protein